MTLELIFFLILALTAILSAAGMLYSRHAVYSALYLVLNFGAVAVLYLMLGSPFIALSQVTVYGGAIMVLFLFVIMLLGSSKIPAEFKWQTVLPAVVLGLTLVGEVIYLASQKIATTDLSMTTSVAEAAPSPLAEKLFTVYLLPFEITSILLLVALVGAIVLTHQEKRRPHVSTVAQRAEKKGEVGER